MCASSLVCSLARTAVGCVGVCVCAESRSLPAPVPTKSAGTQTTKAGPAHVMYVRKSWEKMQMASFLCRHNPILRRIKVSVPWRPLHDDVYSFDVVHFHAHMHECAGEGEGGGGGGINETSHHLNCTVWTEVIKSRITWWLHFSFPL